MPLNMIYLGVQLLLLTHVAQSFILVTANMDDIKKIARKFFSESLAGKISEFIATATSHVVNKEVSGENNQYIADIENISEDNEKLNKARQRDEIDKITDDFVLNQAIPQNIDGDKTNLDKKSSEKGTAQNIQWENEIDNFSLERNPEEIRQETPEEEHAKLKYRQKQTASTDGREPSAYRGLIRKPIREPIKKTFKGPARIPIKDTVRESVRETFIEPARETISENVRETGHETPPASPNREFVKRPKAAHRKLKNRLHRPFVVADRDTDIYQNAKKPTSVEFINEIKHFTKHNVQEPRTISTTEADETLEGEKNLPLAIQGIINKKHRFSTIKSIDSTILSDDLLRFKQHVNRFRLTAVDSKEEQHYETTTEKERTDFDQYDNVLNNKAELIATSGPVVLPKVAMLRPWWEREMPK